MIKKKSYMRNLFLLFCITLSIPCINVIATEKSSAGINVEYHTQEEIRNYIRENGASTEDPITYASSPVLTAPYQPGQLSPTTLQSAVNMLNQIRYIAGISYNVTINDTHVQAAQAASLVSCVNGVMTHYPTKPEDMEDTLFNLGYKGASSSNLGMGYMNLNESIKFGWMSDGDSSNIDRIGHRRWILNPQMDSTGFGVTGTHCAMYALSRNGSSSNSGVAWPAQNMPTDFFKSNDPWSISMGTTIDSSATVTLTRRSDNKIWNFSTAQSDGYFNINNDGYGITGCIIFRPDGIGSYNNGDIFDVTISNLSTPVTYTVNFFDLNQASSLTLNKNVLQLRSQETASLQAFVSPTGITNAKINWSSTNHSVATVTSDGLVYAIGTGTATITASLANSNLSATCFVTIAPSDTPTYIPDDNINNTPSPDNTITKIPILDLKMYDGYKFYTFSSDLASISKLNNKTILVHPYSRYLQFKLENSIISSDSLGKYEVQYKPNVNFNNNTIKYTIEFKKLSNGNNPNAPSLKPITLQIKRAAEPVIKSLKVTPASCFTGYRPNSNSKITIKTSYTTDLPITSVLTICNSKGKVVYQKAVSNTKGKGNTFIWNGKPSKNNEAKLSTSSYVPQGTYFVIVENHLYYGNSHTVFSNSIPIKILKPSSKK